MSSTMVSTGASIETVDRMFVGCRRLQRLELAVQQARRHEMSFAPGEPVGDQGLRAVEKDDPHIVAAVHQDIAIGAFQRRAGDHDMAAGLADPVDLVGDRLQPRPAVFVGERMAGAHLGDVAGGMKPVAVLEGPAQAFGEVVGDGAFARAGHAHHDQRAGRFVGVYRPRKFSGSAA